MLQFLPLPPAFQPLDDLAVTLEELDQIARVEVGGDFDEGCRREDVKKTLIVTYLIVREGVVGDIVHRPGRSALVTGASQRHDNRSFP